MKWTVLGKIGVLALVALAGNVALTTLMWTQVNSVYDATNFANVNTVPSLRDLGAADEAVAALREGLWTHLAQTDEIGRQAVEQSLAKSLKQAGDALDKYEREDMDEPPALYVPDKANLDASRALVGAYSALKTRIVALSRSGQPGEARALLEANRGLTAALAASFAAHRKLNMDFAAAAAAEAATARTSALTLAIAVALLASLGVAGIGWTLARAIVGPLKQAVGAAECIAAGDLTVPLQTTGHDESAQLIRALSAMREKLAAIVHGVRDNAEGVATASAQIAHGNQDLSQRTEQQASTLQQTASSIGQLETTVQQAADGTAEAHRLAQDARTVAVAGGQVVAQVVDTMREINSSSKRIADITSVIDGIAFQTNILALNAAVEAARAGEQGRGFAVVATEVRSLAQRSAAAAKEIKSLIGDSVVRVDQGTALVDRAGHTMNEIVGAINALTDIVAEISAASTAQRGSVGQIGETVAQMDQATQQNSALVEESAAAAESLRQQADQLVAAVGVFRLAR